MKKLIKRNPTFGTAMKEKFPDWFETRTPFVADKDFDNFRDGVAKIYDRMNYSAQEEMDRVSMNDMYALKPDSKPYLTWLGCARTRATSIECDQLTQIDSIQDRRCMTILHAGAMLYDSIHHPELFNSTQSISGPYSYFGGKEVVKLLVNFEPEDYADLKRQIGSRVIFHSNYHVAASTDPDFFITRGFKYEFNLDREDLILADGQQNCRNYEEDNMASFKENIDTRKPLDGETCVQNCVVKNVIHHFNCWPATMPYYRNDSYDPNLNLDSCSWFREPPYFSIYRELLRVEDLLEKLARANNYTLQSNSSIETSDQTKDSMETSSPFVVRNPATSSNNFSREMRFYTKIRRHCWSKCAQSCKATHYSVTVTRTAWPSNVGIAFDKSGEDRMLRHCCALVTIKYPHFHYNVQEFVPKYNLADTLGNVGGLLAVWLGLSIVSVYRTIKKLVEIFNETSLAKINPIQSFSYKLQSTTPPTSQDAQSNP